jgi:hypothetical protein
VIRLLPALVACVPFWLVEFPPIQDLPNHLGRVHVLSDLLSGGAVFGAEYEAAFLPLPNIAADLLLLPLFTVFSAAVSGKILLSFVFLLTAFAGFFYLDELDAPEMGWLALPLLWNTFVHRGFLSFLISVPLVLIALGLYHRHRGRPVGRDRVLFVLLATAVWFAHLFSFAFLLLVVTTQRFRQGGWRKAVLPDVAFLPGLAFWVWVTLAEPKGAFWIQYVDLPEKAWLAANLFRAYFPVLDLVAFGLYVSAVALAVRAARRDRLLSATVILIAYVLLPRGAMEGWFVAMRALPFFAFFALSGFRADPVRARVLGLAMLLVTTSLAAAAYLDLGPGIAAHVHAASAIERGATIVPLTESEPVGEIEVYHHEVTWLVSRRDAITPHLFAKRRQHTVRARSIRPAPHEYWFLGRRPALDLGALADEFDYAWLTGDERVEDDLRRHGALLLGEGALRVYRLHPRR